jgi:hypothetical protein
MIQQRQTILLTNLQSWNKLAKGDNQEVKVEEELELLIKDDGQE